MPIPTHTSETIASYVEHRVSVDGLSYMDAVLDFCETKNVEPEDVARYLNEHIVSAIGQEGRDRHLLVGDDTDVSLF